MPQTQPTHTLLSAFTLADMQLEYWQDSRDGAVGLRLLPCALASMAVDKDCHIEPLVQCKLVGDDYADGYASGRTMRGSKTVRHMVYAGQTAEETDGTLRIVTSIHDPERSCTYLHHAEHRPNAPYLTV